MSRAPVEHEMSTRTLARLPSGERVATKVHRYVGGDGPTVYIQAAQHGIELNGPAALYRLHDRLVDAELAGTVIAVPVANPLAFDARTYITPSAYDAREPNMNRSWPGDESGTLGARIVASLWELASNADAVVDLHTGTADMLSHVRHQEGAEGAREMARQFGTGYRLLDDRGHSGSSPTAEFRTTATSADIPAITVELGNSRSVSRHRADAGTEGLLRVLAGLAVRQGEADPPKTQTVLRGSPAVVMADASGLFEPTERAAVGVEIAAGEPVGEIYDPASFESLGAPTAEDGGVVYSIRKGTVMAGERVAALGAII